MLRRVRVLGIAGALCVAVVVLSAGTAAATSWGPLTSYYNGTSRVYADGNFSNNNHEYATNSWYLNDPANDGNNVYVRTAFYFYEYDPDGCNGGCVHWTYDTTKTSSEYSYWTTPVTGTTSRALHPDASGARGKIDACAQMGWPVPDSCSDYAYPSFSY